MQEGLGILVKMNMKEKRAFIVDFRCIRMNPPLYVPF